MTLIDLWFYFLLVVGAVLGAQFAVAHDAGPGLTALMIWTVAQNLALFGTLALLILLEYVESWRTGRPGWPACRCGNTKYSYDRALERSIATCPCGAQYLRHGRECRELLPGGASRPYLRWLPFRRWVDVSTADSTAELSPYRGSEPPR